MLERAPPPPPPPPPSFEPKRVVVMVVTAEMSSTSLLTVPLERSAVGPRVKEATRAAAHAAIRMLRVAGLASLRTCCTRAGTIMG